MDATNGNRADRVDWTQATIFPGVALIIAVIAAASYDHEFILARGNDQAGWVAAVLPVSVDGLLLVASVAALWGIEHGLRRPWRPYTALAVGMVATVGANLYSGLHYVWLQRAVSVWSGVAVVLAAEVGMWYIATRRKLATGEPLRPVGACAHPPLPLTLADWLPLARAELEAQGKPHGEQELANRMTTTRHQVKLALANDAPLPVTPGPAGVLADAGAAAPPQNDNAAAPALNGSHRA